ncbi:MAG TPA: SGNH/GDSL hydrolase family protein [Gemmatimonadaceae bacterium]|jgi:lysophospholipase L1-like esterase
MSRSQPAVRGALFVGLAAITAAVAVACNGDTHLVNPPFASPIFQSYVAIGNSLTAGYQSGGINDSTQRQSYAYLLAHQMGTRFAYPSLKAPGCPPPVNNFLAQTRVGNGTASTCALRDPASVTAILNDVAVPGIATADPDTTLGPNGNALSELILGGKTMIQKALDAQPTFATVWLGNNDILVPALGGFPAGATPVSTFIANYAKDINTLMAGAPQLKGVLIGVVQVANAPIVFRAALIDTPSVKAAASQVAGRPVSLDPLTCAGTGATALINFQYLVAIQSRPAGFPGTVYCGKVGGGGATDPGDNGVLDPAEQVTVTNTINGYNAYIKAKADTIGFAYYDPNPTLVALAAAGKIPPFPILTSAQPFGQYFTLDGVHPSASAHIVIMNGLVDVINAKYQTSLAKLPSP